MAVVIVVAHGGGHAIVGLTEGIGFAKSVWSKPKGAVAVVKVEAMLKRLFNSVLTDAEGFRLWKVDVQKPVAIGIEDGGSGCLLLHEVVHATAASRLDKRQAGCHSDIGELHLGSGGRRRTGGLDFGGRFLLSASCQRKSRRCAAQQKAATGNRWADFRV
jgi:hypothetical protein